MSIRTIGGSSGGVAAAVVNFLYRETVQRAERLVNTLTLLSTRILRSSPVASLRLGVTQQHSSVHKLPTGSQAQNESEQRSETGTFIVGLRATSRSGTPDTDDWGDAWTNATVGQTGVNHGNEDPLSDVRAADATEQRGYTEINLARFSGLTAAGTHTFTFHAANGNLLVAANVNVSFGAQGSRPFTESTITQANQPAVPTAFSRVVSLPAGGSTAYATYTITLTDAEMQQLLGSWVLIVFRSDALDATAHTIRSRERTTVSERMSMNFTARV